VSESSSVVVHLLDKEYRVACDPGEKEDLLRAARYLDDKMREVKEANVIGLERIAVMTALNLAHELLQASGQLTQQSADTGRVSTMLNKVEAELRALNKHNDQLF